MFSLVVGSYNPFRANSQDRLDEILRRTSSFDGLCLVGTKVKASLGTSVRRRSLDLPQGGGSRVLVEAGYRLGPFVTNAAGCSILLGRKFREHDVVRVAVPPSNLLGRGLLVRATNRMADITFVALYYPPRPRELRAQAGYRQTCDLLTSWLASQLCALPQRTTPILGMDLNDGMGLIQHGRGEWRADGHDVIPPEFASKAHYAGIAVSEALATHDICVAQCARE